MDISVKLLFYFFLLTSATGRPEPDSTEDLVGPYRQFHIDQNTIIRKTINSDMETNFDMLWQMMTKRNTETILKIERLQKSLSVNLSREFNENMGNLYRNLSGTINLKSAKTDLNVERSLSGLSASFTQKLGESHLKVERSLRNLSISFGEQLLRSESKLMGQLGTLNETLRTNHQQLLHSVSHLTSTVPTSRLTEMEVVNLEHGTIYFTGGTHSQLRRKIWIFQSEGGDSYRKMSFIMQKMRLGGNARLSLFDLYLSVQHEWKGSRSNWTKEQDAHGHLIMVTLTISPGAAETPSFKLKFNTTSTTNSNTYEYTSEVLRKERQQVVSFPSNNTENYPPRSSFVAVVAPHSGRSFGLTLKYIDIPETLPTCKNIEFGMWSLNETASGDLYKVLPLSVDRKCRSVGALSEPLVNSPVAILRFFNNDGPVGRGFRVEVN